MANIFHENSLKIIMYIIIFIIKTSTDNPVYSIMV